MSTKYPILLKTILIIHFPMLIVVIVVLFMAALVYCFFMGIYIMVEDMFEEFGWLGGLLLLPLGMFVGGVGAAFFPWVFRPWIIEIHYFFWIEMASSYFEKLGFSKRR